MHQIQINIITNLAFVHSARYSDLKPIDMEGSQFTYHLDELIKSGLIVKLEDGEYSLTLKGKQYANTLDIKIAEVSKRQIISTIFTAIRTNAEGEKEYLLYTRKRNPWLNCQGFATSRVQYGETIENAAKRGLLEQAGLTGTGELFQIIHSVVYSKEQELLEDFVLFAYVFKGTEGEPKTSEIGDIRWVKESELDSFVKRPIFKYRAIMASLQAFNGTAGLSEFKGVSNYY